MWWWATWKTAPTTRCALLMPVSVSRFLSSLFSFCVNLLGLPDYLRNARQRLFLYSLRKPKRNAIFPYADVLIGSCRRNSSLSSRLCFSSAQKRRNRSKTGGSKARASSASGCRPVACRHCLNSRLNRRSLLIVCAASAAATACFNSLSIL